MAKKPSETEVENYRHDAAKRINIPTAENQSLMLGQTLSPRHDTN